MFSARKVRRKRHLNGAKTLGYRYETFTIDAADVKKQIQEEVFGFMDRHGLDELILDNASCQDGLRGWIEDSGYKSPGFASKRRDEPSGYPPNSPDCMLLDAVVFGRFKVLFALARKRFPKPFELQRKSSNSSATDRKLGCNTWITLIRRF